MSRFQRSSALIARIRSSEYTRHPKLFADEALSVDVWISPEQLVCKHVERLIEYPGALQVLDFADGRAQLESMEYTIDELARAKGVLGPEAARKLAASLQPRCASHVRKDSTG